jgi:hypothetical protein
MNKLAVVPKPEIDKQKSWGVIDKYKVKRAINRDTELSPGARLIANLLLDEFRHNQNGRCNPSHETLAKILGFSRRTIINYLNELRNRGWLRWEGTHGGGPADTNQYIFLMGPKRDDVCKPVHTRCENSGDEVCKIKSRGVNARSHEPTKNLLEPITLSAPVADAPSAASDKFEEFWKVYPGREGPNPKKPAKEKFLSKVKAGADPDDIIAAAKRLATGEAKNVGTRFIPMAQTWLYQERWKDHQPSLPSPSVVSVVPSPEMSMEDAVAQFARLGIWSRHAPVADPCQAPPQLMAKYGMLPDGRKLPKEAA